MEESMIFRLMETSKIEDVADEKYEILWILSNDLLTVLSLLKKLLMNMNRRLSSF